MGGAHSPPRRGGEARSAGVVSSAKRCASLLFRLRPIGLALRATPSAPLRWLRGIFLVAQPPLLCEEGNISVAALPRYAFLRPFLLAGELARNHNRLGFHVIVERFRAVLFAQAALLQAAKRQLIENDLRRVDPCIPGYQSLRSPRCLV